MPKTAGNTLIITAIASTCIKYPANGLIIPVFETEFKPKVYDVKASHPEGKFIFKTEFAQP